MKNELLDKGIILPSGEIGKDKINLVAGAITQPFAEMVWVMTGGDMETINRLRFVTNTSSGMGLMKCGNVVIPFDNTIEKGTDLYNLYNTNIHEKIQMQKMAEKGQESS